MIRRLLLCLLLFAGCAPQERTPPAGTYRGEDPNRIPTGATYAAIDKPDSRVRIRESGEAAEIKRLYETLNWGARRVEPNSPSDPYEILDYSNGEGDSVVAFEFVDAMRESSKTFIALVSVGEFREKYRCVDGCVPGDGRIK